MIDNKKLPKLILLGIDGGTFDLIEPWAEEGKLPNFKDLMEKGVWGEMQTTIPPVTCPAWPTMYTGLNPGKHGVFDFIAPGENEESKIVRTSSVDGEPVWNLLGGSGHKVSVDFVPVTYPPEKVSGNMISGLPSPDHFGPTYPEPLKREMEKEIGGLDLDFHSLINKHGFYKGYLKGLRKQFEKKKEIFYFLLKNNPDFMFFVFTVVDTLGHWYWKFMEEGNDQFSDAILEGYKMIDRFLGELKELETNIMIVSDHGFGPMDKMVNLNNYLLEKGYLRLKNSPFSLIKKLLFRAGLTPKKANDIAEKLGWENPEETMDVGKTADLLDTFFLSFSDVDWDRSKAFAKGHYSQIYINAEDREKVKRELIEDLSRLKNKRGEEIVDKIYLKENIYEGTYLEEAPDLILKLQDYTMTSYPFLSSDNETIVDHVRGTTGGHRENAMFLSHGPDFGSREIELDITDIAPTILHLYGQKIPKRMDGTPQINLFSEGSEIASREVQKREKEKIRIRKKIEELQSEI